MKLDDTTKCLCAVVHFLPDIFLTHISSLPLPAVGVVSSYLMAGISSKLQNPYRIVCVKVKTLKQHSWLFVDLQGAPQPIVSQLTKGPTASQRETWHSSI